MFWFFGALRSCNYGGHDGRWQRAGRCAQMALVGDRRVRASPIRFDWWTVADRESNVGHRGDWERGKSHPWIVCTLGFEHPRVGVALRTTQLGYEGFVHGPHARSCGSPTCCIDRPGTITTTITFVDDRQLAAFSCTEPDV